MKKYLFLLVFLTPMFFGFSAPKNSGETNCPAPGNVTVTGQGSGSVSFDWDDCGCIAPTYLVSYFRQEGNVYSPVYTTSASNFSFSGLPAGTYRFFFQTDCGNGMSEIGIEDIIIV